jgi:MFS family permease/quinol monooxygenase YgiN
MYNVASGWLMTSLSPDPFVVAMVQVANSLPMFLFAIPAGALVDGVDRRRFLALGESAITLTSAAFALLVSLHLMTPSRLLLFSFLASVGSAMTAPAWQAVVSQLVPKSDLPAAVAVNSVGINVSRAIGPALGGLIVGLLGIAAPFWFDAFSNIGVIAALIWWRPPAVKGVRLNPEPFLGAIRTGIRHARYNSHLSSTLIRAVAFFSFASAYWAMLPLVARDHITGVPVRYGPAVYGVLLGAIGASAVAGAFWLPRLRNRLGADRLLIYATLATAGATALFAVAHDLITAVVASLIAGVSWIGAVSSLNVSAQVALPEWVRGRGLAVYVTVMFGALAAGSAVWGEVGVLAGVSASLLIAAVGAVAAIPLTLRWRVQTGAGVDFSPAMLWPAPITVQSVDGDRGPVLVTVEYQIDPGNREPFLRALAQYATERLRDGAYDWGVFEDPAQEGRFVETFRSDSWLDHLRQHQRVTNADRVLQDAVLQFQVGGGPKTTHLVGAQTRDDS